MSARPDTRRPPRAARARTLAGRAADWIVPVENPVRLVYGIIAIGALLAAESGHHETHSETAASAALAAGLYWLAHAYSKLLGDRLATRARLTMGAFSGALVEESPILRGAAIPVFALLIAWAVGASQETGVTVALWTAVASVVVLELAAGIRSRATPGELAIQVGAGVAMGTAIIALKIVLD